MEPRVVRLPLSSDEFLGLFPEGTEMVKVVVDLTRKILALGGELHADGEQVLLDDGSKQEDLWGANVYPKKTRAVQIEYTSLINIRPRQGNRKLEIEDSARRGAIEAVLRALLPLS